MTTKQLSIVLIIDKVPGSVPKFGVVVLNFPAQFYQGNVTVGLFDLVVWVDVVILCLHYFLTILNSQNNHNLSSEVFYLIICQYSHP